MNALAHILVEIGSHMPHEVLIDDDDDDDEYICLILFYRDMTPSRFPLLYMNSIFN